MKEKLLQIPVPLRKHLLLWFCGCLLSLAMTVVILGSGGSWKLSFPCLCMAFICAESGFLLWDRCIQKKYVIIEGTCTDIERAYLRKRIKAVYIRQAEFTIRFVGVGMIEDLRIGDTVTVYLAENTNVYEIDGHMVICNYMAMARGGSGNEARGDIVQTE